MPKQGRRFVTTDFSRAAALALGLLTAACTSNSTSTTTPTVSTTTTTEILTGTVPPPVNGVLQSAFNPFTVGQGGGQIAVTLTSATETLPGGTLLTTVAMGLGVGTSDGTTCTLLASGFTIAQAGSAPQLSGTVSTSGAYCVQLSDVSNQVGPVAYAVAVTHP
jgi:hypothetical protein